MLLSAQAGIDGVVLLALKPDNWEHLVATSPNLSCAAPLESIQRASLELLSPRAPGNPLPMPGDSAPPEHNHADRPGAKRQGDDVTLVTKGIAKKTPDDHTVAAQDGPENIGASKVDQCTATSVDGGRNGLDDPSPASGCLLGGDRPLTAGAGLSDGVRLSASGGGGTTQSPAGAAG